MLQYAEDHLNSDTGFLIETKESLSGEKEFHIIYLNKKGQLIKIKQMKGKEIHEILAFDLTKLV